MHYPQRGHPVTAGTAVSSGTLDVSVKYLGFSVYSKTGPICNAVPCPLAEGPAMLTFNQEMLSAAPPVSHFCSNSMMGLHGGRVDMAACM
jgi:hypothetical protein